MAKVVVPAGWVELEPAGLVATALRVSRREIAYFKYLFESYEVTLVASLILGAAAYQNSSIGAIAGVMFPLFVRAVGVVTSMIGILAVAPRSEDEHGMKSINRGFFLSAIISAVAVLVISNAYMHSYKPGIAVSI